MIWTIIAISWCDWRDKRYFNDLSMDKFIISQSSKKKQRVLFIPTASWDNKDYCNMFEKVYGQKLWCKTDFLLLYKKHYTFEQLLEISNKTDIIYISWWDTKKMLTKRKQTWFDKILTYFYLKWGIISWVSAGAMCSFTGWFWDSGRLIKWLDFIKGNFIPHFLKEKSKGISRIMKKSRVKTAIWFPDYSLFYKHANDQKIGVFNSSLDIILFSKHNKSIKERIITLNQWFHDISLLTN